MLEHWADQDEPFGSNLPTWRDFYRPTRPYRHRDFQLKGEREQAMIKILKEFIEQGLTEPCSSESAFSCFVVPKELAGEWMLVVEYRDLNSESQQDAYFLPLIDNLLQKQQGKRIFSVLHLKQGYHQMLFAKRSRGATAMSTPLGLMPWKEMPMRVKNCRAQFQHMTEDL